MNMGRWREGGEKDLSVHASVSCESQSQCEPVGVHQPVKMTRRGKKDTGGVDHVSNRTEQCR